MDMLNEAPEGMSVSQLINDMECSRKPTTYQMAKLMGVMSAEGEVEHTYTRPRRYSVPMEVLE